MSPPTSFQFTPATVRSWGGRYSRIPGDAAAFHVRHIEGAWWPVAILVRGTETGTCPMLDDGDVPALVAAVNAGKAALGATPGGAFLIDEYGCVLVPASTRSGTVVVVGECSGPLRFLDPFASDEVFDLYDTRNLACGAPWHRPYIGIRHNLSAGGAIYFWDGGPDGARALRPSAQDRALVAALRRIRPSGAVRFIVGPGGVVLTKIPPAWEPRYVGRIDPAKWFPKEELT